MTAHPGSWFEGRGPSWVGAVVLHLAVLLVLMLKPQSPLPNGNTVAVTLVTGPPSAAPAPQEIAPAPTPAQAPEVAQEPTPPMRATPAAAPAPKPVPTPTPKAKPAPARPADQPFSLDNLQSSLARSVRKDPARAPHQGDWRPQAGPAAQAGRDSGVSQSDQQGLRQLLQRLWNPCFIGAERHPPIQIRFYVGDDGRVVGQPAIVTPGVSTASDPAARRAVIAIHQAEPYQPVFRDHAFTVNFDGRSYCANR